jgi:cytoskeleton protein RodZ
MAAETSNQKPIGDQLRSARELKGWTLAEAAKRTKVKVEQLDKLEKSQFDLLPSLAYARGFIRIYARELGLDGWSLLRQFNGEVDSGYDVMELQPHDLEAIPKRQQPASATPQNFGLLVIMGLVLVALIIGGIQVYRMWPVWMAAASPAQKTELTPIVTEVEPAPAQTAAPAPAAKPAVVVAEPAPAAPPRALVAEPVETNGLAVSSEIPVAPPAAIPVAEPAEETAADLTAGANRLQLQADGASSENERWVRVVGIRAGKEMTLYEDILPPGQAVPGQAIGPWTADQFIVTFREASAVDIIFNGSNYGRYEKSGVQRVPLPAR